MTYDWREQPGALVGLRGFLTSDRAANDLVGRVRVGGVVYRVRCWRCEERGGQVQWQMQLAPEAAGAAPSADVQPPAQKAAP